MWHINLCNLINDFVILLPDVMVGNHKRKSGKGVFDSSIMQRAVHEVVQNGGKIRTVARDMQVDRMTLTRYVKKFRVGQINEQDILIPKLNTRQVSMFSFLIFHTKGWAYKANYWLVWLLAYFFCSCCL